LFVDGSADPCASAPSGFKAGVGACILDPTSREYRYFGGTIPQNILEKWVGRGARHVIAQAELLPVLLARRTFGDLLGGRTQICFVDNEAARCGLIRGSSVNEFSAAIIEEVVGHDLRDHAMVWYARVPSESNLADDPSRGRAPQPLEGWRPPRQVAVDFRATPYG